MKSLLGDYLSAPYTTNTVLVCKLVAYYDVLSPYMISPLFYGSRRDPICTAYHECAHSGDDV